MTEQRGRGPTLGRRSLLKASGASAAAIAMGISAPEAAGATPDRPIPDGAFGLGVASGEPRFDGMVLWTRLAPEPLAADGHGGMPIVAVPVHYQVAEDDRFRRVVREGSVVATPELAHAVHPEIAGLRPGREYFYRFRVGSQVSPTGRTKTMPARGSIPEGFSFATTSCQAWYHGHFTAYRHLAREDLDLVFFLGDYIYEYGITATNLWRQGVSVGPEHGFETETLEQYRLRYGLFKSDPHLRAVHAAAPCLTTWDDHEVQNNYGADVSSVGIPPEHFVYRRAVAYRAYYEHLPLALSARPDGPDLDLYQRYDAGGLARIHTLDARQYRDPPPASRDEQYAEDRTMLGLDQEQWLYDSLAESPATWNVLAGGVVTAAVSEDRTDQWDGYPAARRRLLEAMQPSRNAVLLAGDIHRHVAADVKADYADPASPNVGVELICTSIGSDGDGAPTDQYTEDWVRHPYVKLYDGRRGYVHCRLTPDELTAAFKIVPWIEADAEAPLETVARFRSEAGKPGLERQV